MGPGAGVQLFHLLKTPTYLKGPPPPCAHLDPVCLLRGSLAGRRPSASGPAPLNSTTLLSRASAPFVGPGLGKKFFLRHQNERMNGLSTAAGHRCPVLLSRTSDASLVVWQITHKAPVTGYAGGRGASPAFSPCFCLPAASRPSWECLGPARRVATELAPAPC